MRSCCFPRHQEVKGVLKLKCEAHELKQVFSVVVTELQQHRETESAWAKCRTLAAERQLISKDKTQFCTPHTQAFVSSTTESYSLQLKQRIHLFTCSCQMCCAAQEKHCLKHNTQVCIFSTKRQTGRENKKSAGKLWIGREMNSSGCLEAQLQTHWYLLAQVKKYWGLSWISGNHILSS